MTANFDMHSCDDSGSCGLLHGVYGGNGKKGLKGRLHVFFLKTLGWTMILFSLFCFLQRWRSQGVAKGRHRETGEQL